MYVLRRTIRWSVLSRLATVAVLAAACGDAVTNESPVEPQLAKGANRPPVANAGGPYVGVVNVPIRFDGTQSYDPDGPSNKLTYTWKFSDGQTLTGATAQRSFSTIKEYSVTLTIKDAKGGTASATAAIDIVSNVTPTLDVLGNAAIVPGQTYYITLAFKDTGDPGPWSYSIVWENGEPVAGQVSTAVPITLEKSFAAPGIYNASVSLWDPAGAIAYGTATVDVLPATGPPVFVGAGDIAGCDSTGDTQTATLLDGINGTVFTVGDNAYPNGTLTEFLDCYTPTWGRHKPRTRPAPGNHEYNTAFAVPYYDYFSAAAGEAGKGYYSYDLGSWHIIALNSQIARDVNSAQVQWLRADLQANADKQCTLAYWHHPRWSSGSHGNDITVAPFVDALHEYGADVILVGHDHTYERFAPQIPDGTLDATNGIREFVVGTGGRSLYSFGAAKPNSEVRYNATFGVLQLVLDTGSYSWQYVPVSGSFTDTGSSACH